MHAEIRRRAMDLVTDLRRDRSYRDVLAVLLCGSAARGEERWSGERLDSDIDVMVISRSSTIRMDRTRAVERLIAHHSAAGLEGGRVPAATLRYATLTNYEAGASGVVIDGDQQVRERIALTDPRDIPVWEGVRLLANRLFEHLRHRAGGAGEEWAVRKSYEAIGEAQLVLEGRYRPSFAERAAEIRGQPLDSPVAGAGDRYIEAVEARASGAPMTEIDSRGALGDLLTQLGHALERHSGQPGNLGVQLEALSRSERHISHRAYWAALGLLGGRDGMHAPNEDPIVRLWRAAVAALSGRGGSVPPGELVRLWQRCPQILRTIGSDR